MPLMHGSLVLKQTILRREKVSVILFALKEIIMQQSYRKTSWNFQCQLKVNMEENSSENKGAYETLSWPNSLQLFLMYMREFDGYLAFSVCTKSEVYMNWWKASQPSLHFVMQWKRWKRKSYRRNHVISNSWGAQVMS